ncbi:MAG: hypothetical protein ACI4WT_03140 [Oligosphaeraceae bacterium]
MDRARHLGLLLRRRLNADVGDCFCITALEDGCDVSVSLAKIVFTNDPTETTASLEYSVNGARWRTCVRDGVFPTDPVATLSAGDRIWFRGDAPDGRVLATFKGSKRHSASGSVLSLAGDSSLQSGCFRRLFSNDTRLTDAQGLIFPNSVVSGIFAYAFYGATSLALAPATLPATQIGNLCYFSMFRGCTALQASPVICATKDYSSLYSGGAAMSYMFNGCTKLSRVEVAITSWTESMYGDKLTCYYWLVGASSSGVFVKPSGLTTKRGDSYIPSGWTVIDK